MLKLGILGCASVARYAVMDAARFVPEITVTCIGSRDLTKAKAFAREYGIARFVGSYAEVITDTTIDLVYNPLPNSLHAEWCERAMAAGKPVLCEKPVTVNAAEASALLRAQKRLGGTIIEAYHYRFHPLGLRIAEIATSGLLGKLQEIDIRFLVPSTLLGSDIRSDYALGGGAAIDPGCYCVDLARLVAKSEPGVLAATPRLLNPQVDTGMEVRLEFPEGCIAHFEAALDYNGERVENTLRVTGENGTLHVRNPCNPHLGHLLTLEINGQKSEEKFDLIPSYAYQLRHAISVVQGGAGMVTTLENGLCNMRVLDEIYRAAGMHPRGFSV